MNPQFTIIWSALALSQVIYLFVPMPRLENPGGTPEVFPIALGAVAIAEGIAIVVMLRLRAFHPIQAGLLDPTSKTGAAQLFTTLILAWVIAESVAIYGLVLRFLHFEPAYYLPFAVAGACLLFAGRPWQSRLEKPLSTADLARSNAPLG